MKRLFAILLLLFILSAAIYILLDHGIIWFVYPDRDKYPMRGIDVSHHKEIIDWATVAKDDVSFAFIKATEADDFKDERFAYNWSEARKAGLQVGAYHFYSLRYGGEVQAKNFIDTVPVEADALPPVVDLEFVGNSSLRPERIALQDELYIYLHLVEEHYGKRPILYTTYDFYDHYLGSLAFNKYPIWIRDLFKEPKNEINWTYWQYKNRGHVKGIDGYVDLNVVRLPSNKSF